jgi:hypothetical protein
VQVGPQQHDHEQSNRQGQDLSWTIPVHSITMHEGIGISGSVKSSDVAAAMSEKLSGTSRLNGVLHATVAGPSSGTSEQQIAIGSMHLMRELGISVSDVHVLKWLQREEMLQRTGLLVGYGGKVVACLSIEDPIKPEAGGVMARLQQLGVRGFCVVHLFNINDFFLAFSQTHPQKLCLFLS